MRESSGESGYDTPRGLESPAESSAASSVGEHSRVRQNTAPSRSGAPPFDEDDDALPPPQPRAARAMSMPAPDELTQAEREASVRAMLSNTLRDSIDRAGDRGLGPRPRPSAHSRRACIRLSLPRSLPEAPAHGRSRGAARRGADPSDFGDVLDRTESDLTSIQKFRDRQQSEAREREIEVSMRRLERADTMSLMEPNRRNRPGSISGGYI